MEVLWDTGEANVRTVLDELNRRSKKQRKYTTVMTIMARLDRKRLLSRHREGRTDVYKPLLSRDEYLQIRAQADVSGLVAQYGEVALVYFAREIDRLDSKRRAQLRRLASRATS
jgi:predicted transcriptional regulator